MAGVPGRLCRASAAAGRHRAQQQREASWGGQCWPCCAAWSACRSCRGCGRGRARRQGGGAHAVFR
eukprot:9221936-Lingulodinium_polyedra.AAC.1